MPGTERKVASRFALCALSVLYLACGDDDPTAPGDGGDTARDASADGSARDGDSAVDDAGGGAGRNPDGGGRPRHETDGGTLLDGRVIEEPDASATTDGGDAATPPEETRLRFAQLSVGYQHACAVDPDSALYCWGGNSFGQLGTGDALEHTGVQRVGEDGDWQVVSAGRFHTCALRAGGALYCWGASAYGQAGLIQDSVLEPHAVAAPEGEWRAISVGDWHSCGVTSEGSAYCFGYNLLGRLGDGSGAGTAEDPETAVPDPVRVDLPRAVVALSAGAAHSCAIDEDAALFCWGSAEDGALGGEPADDCMLSGSAAGCSLTPALVSGSSEFSALCAGAAHSCGIDRDGNLFCWGRNRYGQLGSEAFDPSPAPQRVGDGYAAVACGGAHTCALRADGGLHCFGDNENAQLGTGDGAETGADHSWSAIAAGALGSCAIDDSSDGYCWGFSEYAGSETPQPIVPL